MEGEVREALFAEVPEDVSLLGEGFEDWPQPARTVNRAREAAMDPAAFNAFPAFTVPPFWKLKEI